MVRLRGLPGADKARLGGDKFEMRFIALFLRHWYGEGRFVNMPVPVGEEFGVTL